MKPRRKGNSTKKGQGRQKDDTGKGNNMGSSTSGMSREEKKIFNAMLLFEKMD